LKSGKAGAERKKEVYQLTSFCRPRGEKFAVVSFFWLQGKGIRPRKEREGGGVNVRKKFVRLVEREKLAGTETMGGPASDP